MSLLKRLRGLAKYAGLRMVRDPDGLMHSPSAQVGPAEAESMTKEVVDWWANDEYTKRKKYKEVRWLGMTIARIPYAETIRGTYWTSAGHLVSLVREMQSQGIVPVLDSNARVLEPGCNLGRNLRALQDAFGCRVVGLDVSRRAIEIAKDELWRGREGCEFQVVDVLNTDFFDRLPDGHFDFAMTRWHLIHLPATDAKKRYIESLKRVAKVFLALEPAAERSHEVQRYYGGHILSWDDWEKDYGLREYFSTNIRTLGGKTRAFYSKRA